jgi:cyclopropane fatty-acyl-phospholipid synthase-like methyltransferase
MVKICIEKGIDAYELDFYDLSALNKKFDCVWSMNSLLHVPKSDLPEVLINIDSVINENGFFYMGVYGGNDTEHNWVNDLSETPRFFSSYSESKIKEVLDKVFEIISFEQLDVGSNRGNIDFQSIIMRKRQGEHYKNL